MSTRFARERDMTPVVAAWIEAQGMTPRYEVMMPGGYCDITACALSVEKLALREARKRGWRPLHTRLIAVELKLSRIGEVIRQARENLHGAEESWIAMPLEIACRAAANPKHWDAGETQSYGDTRWIGILGVAANCEIIRPARRSEWATAMAVERQVEKFWRDYRAGRRRGSHHA